jgi:hypothetical protein
MAGQDLFTLSNRSIRLRPSLTSADRGQHDGLRVPVACLERLIQIFVDDRHHCADLRSICSHIGSLLFDRTAPAATEVLSSIDTFAGCSCAMLDRLDCLQQFALLDTPISVLLTATDCRLICCCHPLHEKNATTLKQ